MMDKGNSVEVKDLCKTFTVGTIPPKNSKSASKLHRKNFEERVVLDGISFKIKKGESVGILGRNGSGKSTILKMLAKVMHPDSGEIEIEGKTISILELGMGFHHELSGRENIYVKGSMYGLSEKEMDTLIDEIIEFSELDDRIDDPIRVYSSGMYARLAFAIAIKIKSDVVIIDEILSVGDIGFRSKCNLALKDIKKRGTTIIMASHSMNTIERMCDRVIWIDSGKVREIGESSVVCYHFEKDMTDSFESIKASALSGDVISQNNLGVFYRDGKNVIADSEEAYKWFKKAAESGLTDAQLNLGEMILQKNNTEENKQEALTWFDMAADAGNMNAQIRISEILGENDEDDNWTSLVELLTNLAEQGNTRSQATLANILFNGTGITKDYESAFQWYLKSAESGDPASQFQIGLMYRDGLGIEKDSKKAVEWLSVSANNNYMKARTELAVMFKKGLGTERDLPESLKWYREAANTGDAGSMYQAAIMCRDGIGTEINLKESNIWFNLFSKQGRLRVQNTLGEICRYDTKIADSVAIDIYEGSAKAGNLAAGFTLAILKKDGTITTPDAIMAAEWFKKTSEHGHVGAQIELGNMLLRGIGIERDLKAAFTLFKKAADAGNSTARTQLGIMYRDGIGTEKDPKLAKTLFQLASEQGNKNATLSLLLMNDEPPL